MQLKENLYLFSMALTKDLDLSCDGNIQILFQYLLWVCGMVWMSVRFPPPIESFSKNSYKKHKRDDLFIIAAMCNVEATEWLRAETNKQDTPCLL